MSTERTDTERLDWLENEANGVALIHDDDGHWAVACAGFQNVIIDGPKDLESTYWIAAEKFRKTLREAIDAAMDDQYYLV